jgi:hypothetical protein
LVLICGEFASMPTACGSKMALPRSRVGPGQFATPCERMHRANFTMSLPICCTTAGLGGTPGPPSGSRGPQARVAAWNSGLVATSSTWLFGHTPLLLGSGKFGTPWRRMQWEKASACSADEPDEFELDEPDELDDAGGVLADRADAAPGPAGEPPQAARPNTTATAAAGVLMVLLGAAVLPR